MDKILNSIKNCKNCNLCLLEMNRDDIDKGFGKLIPFWKNNTRKPIMLVGLNPSYRRFPKIYQVFGGEVEHKGTGSDFINLLKELKVLDEVYITNLIKCSHPTNEPEEDSYKRCFKIFEEEVKTVRPKKIVALGKKVYNFLMTTSLKNLIVYVPHPVVWSSYEKITKKEYSQILWNTINIM